MSSSTFIEENQTEQPRCVYLRDMKTDKLCFSAKCNVPNIHPTFQMGEKWVFTKLKAQHIICWWWDWRPVSLDAASRLWGPVGLCWYDWCYCRLWCKESTTPGYTRVLIIPMTYICIIKFKSLLIGIISSCSPSNMGAGPELWSSGKATDLLTSPA